MAEVQTQQGASEVPGFLQNQNHLRRDAEQLHQNHGFICSVSVFTHTHSLSLTHSLLSSRQLSR